METVIVLTPTPAARRRVLLVSLISVPFAILLIALRTGEEPVFALVFGTALVIAIGIAIAHLYSIRIEYGQGRYVHRSIFRTRGFGVADIEAVHTFTAYKQSLYAFADLMVEGKDGKRMLRMPAQLWDVTMLRALAQDLEDHGARLVVTQEPVTAAQVRAAHPGLVSWFEANQILAAVLIGLGVLVLVVVIVAVTVAVLVIA